MSPREKRNGIFMIYLSERQRARIYPLIPSSNDTEAQAEPGESQKPKT